MAALAKVAIEGTLSHDNGTSGKELICHYWDYEELYDAKKAELEKLLVAAYLAGDTVTAGIHHKAIAALPPPKIVMIFKLLQPIPYLKGSKISLSDGKTFSPTMNNVDIIYIPEDAIKLGLCDFDESEDIVKDRVGLDTPIITLKLSKGMIDVKEGIFDRLNRLTRAPRASVTPISYRSMQIAGKILGNERITRDKVYGMTEV